jgi:4-amino-4-deoxy-L-arabinose transferase-like glycosyltransferase
LWPALFAVGGVLATYALAARVATRRTGLMAGLVLATSYMFVYRHCARTFQFDSLLVFSFVLSTVLFLRAVSTDRGWLALTLATALASYAKNFAAAVPVMVFLITMLISRPKHRPTLRQWLWMGLLFAALHLMWLIPMVIVHGRPFLANFLGHQVLGRPGLGHGQDVAFIVSVYLQNLAGGFFPWFFLGIAALPDALYRAGRRDPGRVVLVVWLGVFGVLLCTVLRQALIWYVLPLFPFLAIIGATFLFDGTETPRWLRHWRSAALIVLIALALAFRLQPEPHPFALWSQDRRLLLTWNGWPQLMCLASALLASWWRFGRNLPALSSIVLTLIALVSVVQPLPLAAHQNVYVRAADAIAQAAGGRAPSLSIDLARAGADRLTRYYMAALRPARASYHWSRREAALQNARRLAAPAFAVLVARRPMASLPSDYPGKVIFEGEEHGAPRETYFVKVVHIDEPDQSGRDTDG